ncbi:Beta-lactamase domain-containing protein [Penicillium ucsense]|uniref:Beta-lactamase domain-containing protein n=1 Tax=Penicillium ucsense TaxID=2839758 RepID=A0A8J8W5N3_9EURO|nr:Beta-lactamase domain-containing protein [Penicillium ucsense]KAF7735416.1 Beta-lactamase domain-containing protein [Penicillium ucsense]
MYTSGWLLSCLSLTLLGSASALASQDYCPPLGPDYPPPSSLSNDRIFTAAIQEVLSSLDQVTGSNGDLHNDSISVQIFSGRDPKPLAYFAATSEHINTTLGVSSVDENTVFRVGSVSKIFTVTLLLMEEGLWAFSEPIAKYVPELREAAERLRWDPRRRRDAVDYVNWGSITIGELASHLAGIPRDYGELDLSGQAALMEQLGFPALSPAEIPPCGNPDPCDREQFFKGLIQRHPVVATSSTPVYSNAAFQILAYALEAMTGESFERLLHEDIVVPLGLEATSYSKPDMPVGLIPTQDGEHWWSFDLGDEGPAGGIYSSTRDMTALGQAILNGSLLPASITRRWMKPHTHTSTLDGSVGAPWEIITLDNGRPIDIYSKAGDIGAYSSMIALSPDYDVGFTIFFAGTDGHAKVALAADLISAKLFPGLEAAAKDQAASRFGGDYASAEGVNSTISITTDDGPGLRIASWVNNGTDMIQSLMTMGNAHDPSTFSVRLYPTGLDSPGQIAFRAVLPARLSTAGNGPFTSECLTWVTMDAQVYGGIGIDEFVFNFNEAGSVTSITPRVLRATLPKI